jgi:hypothetical protein
MEINNQKTFTLLPSVQGGPFNNYNKLVDIDTPQNVNIDMSQSFVQITLNFTPDLTKDFGPGGSTFTITDFMNLDPQVGPILNAQIVNTGDATITPMNIDLIKNCSLRSSKKGVLEDIRRIDVLRHNMKEYTMTTAEKLSQVDSLLSPQQYSTMKYMTGLTELHKDGGVPSLYRDLHLRIPMTDLFELGSMTTLDTSNLGNLRTHLEFNDFSRISVIAKLLTTAADGDLEDQATQGNQFITKMEYTSLEFVPYYVGQCVVFTAEDSTGTPVQVNEKAVITNVSYDTATALVSIELSWAGDSGLTYPLTDCKITEVDFDGVIGAITTETVQLSLCTNSASEKMDVLEYTTWSVEEYSQGPNKFLNRVFELEPNCMNVFIMSNNASSSTNSLSQLYAVNTYRMRLDGVDICDRDINIQKVPPASDPSQTIFFSYDGTHYDLLNKTFLNASIPLRNLTQLNLSRDGAPVALPTLPPFALAKRLFLLAAPTPLTATQKQFQLNLTTRPDFLPGAPNDVYYNIDNVILYKQVLKSIKL